MNIRQDDLTHPDVLALLEEHLSDMRATSPPESVHALDLPGLRKADITFWTVWDGIALAGCGALKELDHGHGEIKSMRTSKTYRRRGVAADLLTFILNTARERGYQRLSLETGSFDFFLPARTLYARYGFRECGPFANYIEDPNSVFMTLELL